MLDWSAKLAAANDKKQIVLGLEPTGHYWFCLTTWLVAKGISVVQVNPYAVKQTKEVEDNSQLNDDKKEPKLIANLVKDGNFGMPYLFFQHRMKSILFLYMTATIPAVKALRIISVLPCFEIRI